VTVPTNRRRRNPVLLVLIAAVLVVQGEGVGDAATAAPATGPLSSCPAFASWAWGPFVYQPPWMLPAPAAITMSDGGVRPVGIVTPSSNSGVFTGSSGLSWSPDGTALVYRQATLGPSSDQVVTKLVVGNWDGSSPVHLQGSRVAWSPTSDRLVSRTDDGAIGSIARRTPTGWIVGQSPALLRDVAWSSDGRLLAWSDTGGLVHVGDADGQHGRVVGSVATADSPITFQPHTHLLRLAGPEWYDVDLDAAAGPAPRGTLSPAGDWSAWPSATDWGGLLISHNGAPPEVIRPGAYFNSSPIGWSPDGRYLVADAFEQVDAVYRRAPLLFDTTTGTAAIVGPWHEWSADWNVYLSFQVPMFDWSPDSSSFFAPESVFSQAADHDGQMRLFRYDVDGSRTLVHDWQYNVGATFWPRTTPVAHLDISAHLSPVDLNGTTSLRVTVSNDGPCDAEGVVVTVTTPGASGAADVSSPRAVETLDLGTIARGAHVDRVIDLSTPIDLPVTLAVSTSTADEGRTAGPLTLTSADVPVPLPSTTSTAPPTSPDLSLIAALPAAVAVPIDANPNFTG
jgi:hypothetical protein